LAAWQSSLSDNAILVASVVASGEKFLIKFTVIR